MNKAITLMSHEEKEGIFEVTFIDSGEWYKFISIDNGPDEPETQVEKFNSTIQEWVNIFKQELVNSKEAIEIHYVGLQLMRELKTK